MDTNTLKGKEGEQFVSEIATKTFLKNWCYENPFDANGKKKEICDLLVLFKGICIIWQVKNYEFKQNHDRYFKRSVEKGYDQIKGAYRKLFESKASVEIRIANGNVISFSPELYPERLNIIVHLGEGYLYQVMGKMLGQNGEFVHIFGKNDIEDILAELYTVTDFISYLKAREQLLKVNDPLIFGGKERDLLGWHLLSKEKFNNLLQNTGEKLILNIEGGWEEYVTQKTQNEDVLSDIEDLITRFVNADLIKNKESKNLAEDLLALTRTERRYFAVCFLEFMQKVSGKGLNRIVRRNMELNGIGFVFFYYPEFIKDDYLIHMMCLSAEGYSYFTNYRLKKFIIVGVNEKQPINFTVADFTNTEIGNEEDLISALNELGWFQENQIAAFKIVL